MRSRFGARIGFREYAMSRCKDKFSTHAVGQQPPIVFVGERTCWMMEREVFEAFATPGYDDPPTQGQVRQAHEAAVAAGGGGGGGVGVHGGGGGGAGEGGGLAANAAPPQAGLPPAGAPAAAIHAAPNGHFLAAAAVADDAAHQGPFAVGPVLDGNAAGAVNNLLDGSDHGPDVGDGNAAANATANVGADHAAIDNDSASAMSHILSGAVDAAIAAAHNVVALVNGAAGQAHGGAADAGAAGGEVDGAALDMVEEGDEAAGPAAYALVAGNDNIGMSRDASAAGSNDGQLAAGVWAAVTQMFLAMWSAVKAYGASMLVGLTANGRAAMIGLLLVFSVIVLVVTADIFSVLSTWLGAGGLRDSRFAPDMTFWLVVCVSVGIMLRHVFHTWRAAAQQ